MASRFTQEELYESDIYGDLRKSLEKTIVVQKQSNKVLMETHTLLEKNAQTLDDSAKEVRELNQENEKSKKILQDKTAIQKQLEKLEENLTKVTKQEREALAGLRLEQSKANKEAKLAAKINKGLETEYEKQSRILNDLRKDYKNLILAEGKATKQTKKLAKEIGTLDKRLKQVDKDVGQSQRSVGDYGKGLDKLKGTLGSLGLAFGAFAIVKDVFNINKEFEASLASLSAITGVTGEAFEAFKGGVLDVASETKKSATEVAKAFEIVGSAKPELLADADALAEVTKQSILLSQATRLDLEVSAKSLTGTLNQFNLGANEAGRVINVLAAGSQAGAAPVDQITESMDKFGAVAASLNVSVEESVGLIETLAEKNIVGAEAGTALRNVLLKVATVESLPPKAIEQLEKFGVNTALVADTTVDLSVRLEELGKIQNDVTAITAVFGTGNVLAAQTLLQNQDAIAGYTDAVTDTSTATEQAAINQNTMVAIIDQLKASWESVVLKFSEGSGVLDGLKALLRFVADNLEIIIKVVLNAIAVYGAYTVTTKAVTAANKLLGKSFATGPVGLFVAVLTAVVLIATELISAFSEASRESTILADVTAEVNKRMVEEQAELDLVFLKLKNTTRGTKERQDALDETNAKYGLTLSNLESEAAFVEQLASAYQDLVGQLEARLEAEVREEFLKDLIKERQQINNAIDELRETGAPQILIDEAATQLDDVTASIKKLQDEIVKAGDLDPIDPLGEQEEKEGGVGSGGGSAKKKLTEEEQKLKDLAAFRKQQTKERIELENELIAKGVERSEIETALQEQRIAQFRDEGIFIIDLQLKTTDELIATRNKYLKFVEKTNADIQKSDTDTIENQEDANNALLDSAQSVFAEITKQEQDAAKKRREQIKKDAKETLGIIEESVNLQIAQQQRLIDAKKEEIDASKTEQDRLQAQVEKGVEGAAEALVAEKKREAREKTSLEALEKKKRNLEIVVLGLQRASQLIEGGDNAPFKNAGSELINFLANIPKLSGGTDIDVGKTLGTPFKSGTDGHLAFIDSREKLLSIENSTKLSGMHQDEITRGALMYQNQALHTNANIGRPVMTNNRELIRSIGNEFKEAVKDIEITNTHIDFEKMMAEIYKGNTQTNKHYRPSGMKFD